MVGPVNETLQELFQRRQRELGVSGDPLSTREVWLRVEDKVSYETFRRIEKGSHGKIGDEVADALAIALDVPVSHVLAAAGQRRRLGRFELPRRADRLTEDERRVVVSVIDTILSAGQRARMEQEEVTGGKEPRSEAAQPAPNTDAGSNVFPLPASPKQDPQRVSKAARRRPPEE